MRLSDPDGVVVAEAEAPAAAGSVDLDAGIVRRWQPRGRGDQSLYRLDVELVREGSQMDGRSPRVGFRTVELDNAPDEHGSAFTLVVNGEPRFVRGVNWIPDDPLVTRVDRARYRRRLEDIAALGADLVRVWGGGIYESDDFYDVCDELGLLVWQDFTFACAAYPEDHLRNEVEAEAAEQVVRLMPHPSLVVWNGNNENSWGAVDWGWIDRLDGRPWGDGFYRDLFPSLLARLDPSRPYSVASPYSGTQDMHPNADAHGTKHIWDVWNNVDYEQYRRYVPRFVSEFGWQAPASRVSLEQASSRSVALDSPVMRNRHNAEDGQLKLDRGVATHFPLPTTVDAWIWATQLNQARAIRVGVEHLRSYRGHCMGAIWWQYNDCWPAISWAVADSFERRKPAWYALRAAFADRLLTIQPRGDRLVVVAANDGVVAWADDIRVERVTFDGNVAGRMERAIDLAPGSATWFELPSEPAVPTNPASDVILASSMAGSARRAEWYFLPDAALDYPEPVFDIDVGEGVVQLTATTFIRDLTLLPERVAPDARVDDTLHTLLPGESVRATLTGCDVGALTTEAVRAALVCANRLVPSESNRRT